MSLTPVGWHRLQSRSPEDINNPNAAIFNAATDLCLKTTVRTLETSKKIFKLDSQSVDNSSQNGEFSHDSLSHAIGYFYNE